MRHTIRRFVLAMLSIASSAYAMPNAEGAARRHIQSLHSTARSIELAVGDLDGDSMAVVAYLACWFEPEMECVLGVLKGLRSGSYDQLGVSQRFSATQRLPEIAISKGSVFVSHFRNTLSQAWSTEAQLQYRRGRVIVIGREEHTWSPVDDDQPGEKGTARSVPICSLACKFARRREGERLVKKELTSGA